MDHSADAERWHVVESLFEAALQRPSAEREIYLRGACADDSVLYREVVTLLANIPADEPPPAWAAAAAIHLITQPAALEPGQRVGPYEIMSFLAAGGMGEVYRARDTRLKRDVALKILRESVAADHKRLERFEREAELLAALNHPHIANIYGVEEAHGMRAIVMEFVEGETLADRIAAHPSGLPVAEALAIARQITEALQAAHEKGIVHRDLKPANVKITVGGTVKVLDFGLAKVSGDSAVTREGLTQSGTLLGTPRYMAPEQLLGDPIDARTDLYAAGLLLFEMLTGRPPFDANSTLARLEAMLKTEAPGLPATHARMPLNDIVRRALNRQPDARYQTAADLRADLAGVHRQIELDALVPQAVSGKDAIAVLPFTLLTPSRDDDYLGPALADAVINQLGQIGTVLVRPISAVMRYANQAVDSIVAGRELNVKVVVGGSVQRVDRRLRVHVQALNVRDGSTVAAARHEAEMSELFALQDAVAEGLSRALGITSGDKHLSSPPPTINPKAYELFLRACERLSRVNRWDARTAVDMLEDATRLDPTFADAWARLGEGYMTMHQSFDPAGDWYPKAQKAVRRAIGLQPENAAAHAARAWSLWSPTAGFKIRAVLRETTTAIRLNPACQSAWLRQGTVLHHIGLQDDARACLLAALEMNPNDGFCITFIGQTFLGTGDYDGADDFIARALTLDRTGLYAHLFRPAIALYRGHDDVLLRTIQEARATVGDDPLFHAYEAVFHAREGRPTKARRSLRKALAGRSKTHTHHTMHFAGAAQALLDDRSRSVALIKRAASTGLPSYTTFRDDPFLMSLRGYGPFVNLLDNLKKEVASYRLELG